tara:strand:+ start:350 stop:628 length:279 start_codon:yes stop_codon:yes gene_type:complete
VAAYVASHADGATVAYRFRPSAEQICRHRVVAGEQPGEVAVKLIEGEPRSRLQKSGAGVDRTMVVVVEEAANLEVDGQGRALSEAPETAILT